MNSEFYKFEMVSNDYFGYVSILEVVIEEKVDDSDGVSTGLVVGAVLGSVAFVIIVAVIIIFIIHKMHKSKVGDVEKT